MSSGVFKAVTTGNWSSFTTFIFSFVHLLFVNLILTPHTLWNRRLRGRREPKVYTSRMSFLLTVGFLKVGNQPTTATGNANARCGKCKPCTSFEPSVPFVPSFFHFRGTCYRWNGSARLASSSLLLRRWEDSFFSLTGAIFLGTFVPYAPTPEA